MTDFEIHRGAERPQIVWPFTQQGTAVPLDGDTSVTFKARAYDGTADIISGAGSAVGPPGVVAYSFGTADTSQVGELRGRFIVGFPDGELVSPEFVVRIIDAAPGRGVPGARLSMTHLIGRVRHLIDDAPGPSQEFSDGEIQDALDRNRDDIYAYEVRGIGENFGGGVFNWQRYPLPYTDWETGIVLRDGAGSAYGGSVDINDASGMIVFAANTHGTAYYATGASYDVSSAAADVLERLLARAATRFDVEMDGQVFKRSQVHAQLLQRIRVLRSGGRVRSARLFRSDEVGGSRDPYRW